jgi:NTP pyrophosphatase (non-canonical NTP hydrolase)
MDKPVALDEWHKLVNSIYLYQNFDKTADAVLNHLIEVAGGMSHFASGKQKPGVDPRMFLAKALGWWLALCGKVGVRSVETLVWAKFPYVCPYCRSLPHSPKKCKQATEAARAIDWEILREIGASNKEKMPRSLRSWQNMFNDIYPRGELSTHALNFFRLAEEMGELAEATRLLPITHAYFRNEAADVFAWLMGQANQVDFEAKGEHEWGIFLEEALNDEYPGHCRHCGSRVCRCPPILTSSIGRLSREMPASAFAAAGEAYLFSLEESIEFFRLGDEAIHVHDREIKVTLELLQEITRTSNILLSKIEESGVLQQGVEVKLVKALSQLETVAARQELTQESVNKVIGALQEMPSETRSTFIGFLSNLTSGVWVAVILEALRPR